MSLSDQVSKLVSEVRDLVCLMRTDLDNRSKYATKQELKELEITSMATDKQIAADLQEVSRKQKKTYEEIKAVQGAMDTLNEKIKALEDIVAGQGNDADPDLVAITAELKQQAQLTDDLIPDVQPTPQA